MLDRLLMFVPPEDDFQIFDRALTSLCLAVSLADDALAPANDRFLEQMARHFALRQLGLVSNCGKIRMFFETILGNISENGHSAKCWARTRPMHSSRPIRDPWAEKLVIRD